MPFFFRPSDLSFFSQFRVRSSFRLGSNGSSLKMLMLSSTIARQYFSDLARIWFIALAGLIHSWQLCTLLNSLKTLTYFDCATMLCFSRLLSVYVQQEFFKLPKDSITASLIKNLAETARSVTSKVGKARQVASIFEALGARAQHSQEHPQTIQLEDNIGLVQRVLACSSNFRKLGKLSRHGRIGVRRVRQRPRHLGV